MVAKDTSIWTCLDGRRIRICDMPDYHLLNAIKSKWRAAKEALDNGDENKFSAHCFGMRHLKKEAERRGLNVELIIKQLRKEA